MRTSLSSLLAGLALAAAVPAQCLFTSVTSQSVGLGCNSGHTGCCAIPAAPSFLAPALDVANCQLDVTITALEGCCGVIVPLRVLAIGFQPTFVPLPEFGSGCALQVFPAAILTTPSSSIALNLPPGVSQLNFLAQGVAWSHSPFAPGEDILAFTPPYAISLQ